MLCKSIESKTKPAPPDPVYVFKGNQDPVHSLNFLLNSNEEKLLVGCRDGKIHIWDLKTRQQVDELNPGKGGSCISILLPDIDTMVSHIRGESIVIWNRGPDGGWLKSGNLEAASLEFCSAQLVNLGNSQVIAYPTGNEASISLACTKQPSVVLAAPFSKDDLGNIMGICNAGQDGLMALFETGTICVYDLKNPSKPVSCLDWPKGSEENYAAMCVAFDKENNRGVMGSSSSNISAFKLNQSQILSSLPVTPITNPGISEVAFRRDNKLLATAGWDSRVRIFAWRSDCSANKSALRPLAVLESHTGGKGLQCIKFSPAPVQSWKCNNLLAAAGSANTVCFWDIYNTKI